jgi:ligand-binding sensor domain-containing protein
LIINDQFFLTFPVEHLAFTGSTILAVGYMGLVFSSDQGQTWTSIGKGLPDVTVVTGIVETGSVLFAATYSGVYSSSDNGSSWNVAGNELSGKVMYGITTRGNDLFVATKDNGVFMSASQGNSWVPVNDGFPANTSAYDVAVVGPWLFVATNGKGVWRHPL